MVCIYFLVRDEAKAKEFAKAEDSYPFYDSTTDFLKGKGYSCKRYDPRPFSSPTKSVKKDLVFQTKNDKFTYGKKIRKELEKKGIETMILAFDV